MIHTFYEDRGAFSSIFEGEVDTCRDIADDLFLFEATGAVIASRLGDAVLGKTKNFLSLLPPTEREFWDQTRARLGRGCLFLQTVRGAALVLGGLYPASGLFVAILPREGVSFLRAVYEGGTLGTAVASDGFLAEAQGEIIGDEGVLWDTVSFAASVFGMGRTGEVMNGEHFLRRVLNMARFIGCHVRCRVDVAHALSDVFIFSMPAFAAVLGCFLCEARAVADDRAADVEVFVRDGRIFVSLSMAGVAAKSTAFCRALCERRDFLLDVNERGFCFSPEIAEVSLLGLKNRFVFE